MYYTSSYYARTDTSRVTHVYIELDRSRQQIHHLRILTTGENDAFEFGGAISPAKQ